MRRVGSLLVAAVLSAAGVAAALGEQSGGRESVLGIEAGTRVPDLPRLPARYDAPATVSPARGPVTSRPPLEVTAIAAGEDIPVRALEAYQRAAAVMDRADPGCHLAWPLLAAVGRVESDHGRAGESHLTPGGRARPPILGPRLDGTATARILDTDQGSLDGDRVVDRALGPMQFIPATWAAVAVDADLDGVRDPQDIDDAALAASVFLCAWHDDLATETGQREAVLRYNHSFSYARLVLATMNAYTQSYNQPSGVLALPEVPPAVPSAAVPADPSPSAEATAHDSSWNDLEDPTWAGAAHPEPAPSASPVPSSSTAPTTEPSPSATPSATSTPSPTEPSPSATPSPTSTPTPPPTSTPTPTRPDPAPVASSQADPDPRTPPTDPGAGALTPVEGRVLDACTAASGTPAAAARCLATGLGAPQDDPRVVWILTVVLGLPPEQVSPSPAS